MSLLLPIFFGAAALVGLPVLLHLLRFQPRRHVPFPSLRFLGKDALRDTRRHRLRRWLTLLLRCLAILLVALAFARPFWRLEHTDNSRAVVVVVDNSFSMQADGRREAVEAWLAPRLANLQPPDQLGVLLLHPTPTWLVPLNDNLALGRDALKILPHGYETSRYRAGLDLAGAALALSAHQHKEVVLAADQQRLGWSDVRFDRTLPPGVQLALAPPAAAPKRQAAITSLKVSRSSENRIVFEVVVRSFSSASEARTIAFHVGGSQLGTQRVTLGAGQRHLVRAEYPVLGSNGPLWTHASLDPDELTVDDTAYAALPATDDRRVALASSHSPNEVDFLGRALGSARGGTLAAFQVDPLSSDAHLSPSSVAILRGSAPFRETAKLDAFIAAGGSAWVICNGSPEQAAWLAKYGVTVAAARASPVAGLKLRDLALEHPVFAPFAGHSVAPLLAPTFRRGWSLGGASIEPLARWLDRTVAIAEVSTGAGRLLVTGFGETREDSTFPVQAGYVPFVHQAVVWLAENKVTTTHNGRVGSTLILPGAGTWRPLLSPRESLPIKVNDYITPTVPGIYEFVQGDASRFYAVNVDTAESELTPWPAPEEFSRLVSHEPPPKSSTVAAKSITPAIDERLVDERQAWWWLIAAAVLILFFELALANRTIP